jgi:hypothetical protein
MNTLFKMSDERKRVVLLSSALACLRDLRFVGTLAEDKPLSVVKGRAEDLLRLASLSDID